MAALDGKVALITGGTGALGRVVCAAFVAAGARVVATYVVDAELPEFRRAVPRGADVARVDLGEVDQVAQAVDAAVAKHGRLDALVNLAGGFGGGQPVVDTPVETLERLFAINVRTAYVASRAVLPVMIRQRSGRIINVAARAALAGGGHVAAYAITKSGVAALTRALADEVREHGITVNAVAPSTIDTAANRAAMPDVDPATWVRAEQLAATMVFLASDDAAATSGVVLPVYARA